MAIVRSQYITVAELNEILGVTSYTDDNLINIYEASEKIDWYTQGESTDFDVDGSTLTIASNNLKLATAYQVEYDEDNDDNSYGVDSFSLGKYSANNSSQPNGEYIKIAPKTRRYLLVEGLVRREL